MSDDLIVFAKHVASAPNVTRGIIYKMLSTVAAQRRENGQSPQQAFTKLVTTDPIGRELMAVHQALGRRAATAFNPAGAFGLEITKGLRREMDQPGFESGTGVRQTGRNTPEYEQDEGDDDADDGPSFSELVDQHQAKFPKMSRTSSIDHVMTTSEGRKAMRVEKSVRLRKALAGYG
jgi:hypothetical protein